MVEMMAIGDSLFNGVRSLTINQTLAQYSAPAQVAWALGIPFTTPDYPRDVVINFETWLRDFPNIVGIAADVENNINFWGATPGSSQDEFENIAIASSVYADMWTRTATCAQAEIDALKGRLGADFSKIGGQLAALFFAFNTRFLLNPRNDPAIAGLSSLDIVANRQPRRLLVSIGANNGLWEMGFEAAASGGVVGQPAGVLDARDMADLAMLVGKLKALPPGVEHIYINTLPLPSAVANTMPVPDTSDGHQPGPGAYYRTYENRFGFNYAQLSAAQVGENDLVVKAVNQKLADLVGAGGRIHLVPIDATFQQCDFKTNAEASTVSVGGKVLTNVMTEGPELLFPRYWRGGLIGLDGMHPTIVGYALMAQTILASIEEHEAIVAARPLTLDDAYNADSLLQKVPLSWDVVLDLSLDIRGAGAARLPRPTGPKYDAIASLLGALACKVD